MLCNQAWPCRPDLLKCRNCRYAPLTLGTREYLVLGCTPGYSVLPFPMLEVRFRPWHRLGKAVLLSQPLSALFNMKFPILLFYFLLWKSFLKSLFVGFCPLLQFVLSGLPCPCVGSLLFFSIYHFKPNSSLSVFLSNHFPLSFRRLLHLIFLTFLPS